MRKFLSPHSSSLNQQLSTGQINLVANYLSSEYGLPFAYNTTLNLFEDEKIDWTQNPTLRDFYGAVLGLSRNSRALTASAFVRSSSCCERAPVT